MSTDNLDRLERLRDPEKYDKQKELLLTHDTPESPKGKWENYWYHYKWHTIISILAVLFIVFIVYSMVTREKYDYRLMFITSSPVSDQSVQIIQEELNKYAKDLNDDEKSNTQLMKIELNSVSSDINPQVLQANSTKYMAELTTGEIVMFIVDKVNYDKNIEQSVFADKDGNAATKDTPIEDVAYSVKDTTLGKALSDKKLENDYYICFRVYNDKDPEKETDRDKNNKECHALFERFKEAQGNITK